MQFRIKDNLSKESIAVMRKGRVWVEADKVTDPGDAVFIKFAEDGSARFGNDKKDNAWLFVAIFLEKSDGKLTSLEAPNELHPAIF